VDAPLSDKFTFACRLPDGPPSVSATVTLTGEKYEPILAVQNVTAMRKVFLGGESSLRVSVKNIGPAPFASDISWEAPWVGPPHIDLQPGASAEFSIAFQPPGAGVFRLDRLLQPGKKESRLMLFGECVRPLTASPGKLILKLDPKTGERQGALVLANGLASPQKAQLKFPPRLVGVTSVEVPGSGQQTVIFSLPAQDYGSFQGEIVIATSDASEKVMVEAEAKPADLHVVKPATGVLDLGSVKQGEETVGEIVLKNTGGQTAIVQAMQEAQLRVTPSNQAVRVASGAEAIFAVTVMGDQVGHLQTEAHIESGGLLFRIPVKVDVTPATVSPSPTAPVVASSSGGNASKTAALEGGAPMTEAVREPDMPLAVPPALRPMLLYLAAKGMPVPKEKINPYLERVVRVEIRERTPHSLTIAWNKPGVVPAAWSIEAAAWSHLPTGQLVKDWVPYKNWEPVKLEDDHVGAKLKGLPASARIEIRLMGVDGDGRVSEPSTFAMETSPATSTSPWVWRLGISAVLLAALYGLYRIREGYWDPQWPWVRKLLRL
jgi:hypothetical protein